MNNKIVPTDYLLWAVSCVSLIAGMILPMFSFQKFYILNDTFSLLSGVMYLFREGELFLFLIITLFSIVIPIYKLSLTHKIVRNKIPTTKEQLLIVKRLSIIGKWSMADVFVISVMAATVKLGAFASVQIHTGLFVFGFGVITSMVLVHRQLSGYELLPKRE
ncbi:MAG: paraquat-inducible protein A [gamma proteobacterium endosymbiont of Lamellibrachia anaximandri]|nr:paraquat-inducible protein A [gamma proteobacterium endosymbiont of Lamellibrachia anaximandri]